MPSKDPEQLKDVHLVKDEASTDNPAPAGKDAQSTAALVSHQENADLTGTTIGAHYALLEQLGGGASGVVYRARHVVLNKLVAIKLMALHGPLDEKGLQRFQREAMAASMLDHPNLVHLLEYGVHQETTPYLVMELVEGVSLSQLLAEKGRVSTLRATELALQICAALIHAHKRGVIHRDLKPSNVLITIDDEGIERVKVVDFGTAKIIGKESAGSTLTATGELIGTPLYMSPEQCAGGKIDERSDIYSIGCILYEMVAGRPVVTSDSALGAMMAHVHELKPDFDKVNVLPHFKAITEKCLKRDRELRFSNVSQLYKALVQSSKKDLVGWLAKLDLTLEQKFPKQPGKRMSFKLELAFIAGMLLTTVIVLPPLYQQAMFLLIPKHTPKFDFQESMTAAHLAIDDRDYAAAIQSYEEAAEAAQAEGSQYHLLQALQAEETCVREHPLPPRNAYIGPLLRRVVHHFVNR